MQRTPQQALQTLNERIEAKNQINTQFVNYVQTLLTAVAGKIQEIQKETTDTITAQQLDSLSRNIDNMSVNTTDIPQVAQAKEVVQRALSNQGVSNDALPEFTSRGGSKKSHTRRRSHLKVKKHKSKRRRSQRRR